MSLYPATAYSLEAERRTAGAGYRSPTLRSGDTSVLSTSRLPCPLNHLSRYSASDPPVPSNLMRLPETQLPPTLHLLLQCFRPPPELRIDAEESETKGRLWEMYTEEHIQFMMQVWGCGGRQGKKRQITGCHSGAADSLPSCIIFEFPGCQQGPSGSIRVHQGLGALQGTQASSANIRPRS